MNIELSGRYIFLAIIIVCGILLEAIKLIPHGRSTIAAIEEAIFQTNPYNVSEKKIKETAHAPRPAAPVPMIANPAVPQSPEINLKEQIAKWEKDQQKIREDEAKKKKAAKGWHWVWNKKYNRWVWKKKAKKKKETTHENAIDFVAKIPKKGDAKPSDSIDPGAVAPLSKSTTTALNTPAAGPKPQKFLTEAEWENLLIKTPSKKETDMFVQQYKQHMVTDQVFYSVVGKMLKNNNLEAQKQGIYALGQTDSVKSFNMLVAEQQGLQTGSPLYQQTTQYLDEYREPKSLPILAQALGQPSANAQVLNVAINELQASMQKYLGPSSNPTSQSANISHYKAFIPVLTQLANNQGSPVSGQAQSLLSELQRYTGAPS